MKTLTKLTPFLMAVIAIFIISCKGKTGSGTSKDTAASTVTSSTSASASTTAAKSGSVIDSLNITDADEKKVCTVYDECVTIYLDELKELYSDTSKQSTDRKAEIEKKYEDKVKALQPDIDKLKKLYQSSPAEGMKFMQFQAYEGKRIGLAVNQYTQEIMKRYSMPKKN